MCERVLTKQVQVMGVMKPGVLFYGLKGVASAKCIWLTRPP